MIPFSDFDYGPEERSAVGNVTWPSKNKLTEQFEAELGAYLGSNVCVVNNGSMAIMVALLANGVEAGDTISMPDFTFVATASVPVILGCRIVPVDADPETFNVNQPVDITTDVAGLPTPWAPTFVEDAAEALGSEIRGKKTGAEEDYLTVFSFQATKQLPTIEGGAIASTNEGLIDKCRKIADYGRTSQRYVHGVVGLNGRITDLQSAIGLVQLKKLDASLKRRAVIDQTYRDLCPDLQFQKVPSWAKSSHWAVIAKTQNRAHRDAIIKRGQEAGVDIRTTFYPIHLQPCFPELKHYDCPNSVELWERGVMLPIFNTMTFDQAEEVVKVVNGV